MVENTFIDNVYINLTRAGFNIEKTVRTLSSRSWDFPGTIDSGEIVTILTSGFSGFTAGVVSAGLYIGEREKRGEDVTNEKLFFYGIMPLIFAGLATFEALQDYRILFR